MTRLLTPAAAAFAALLLLAGCGAGRNEDTASTSPTAVAPSQLSDAQTPPERLTVDVTITGATVTPTNEQLRASVGEPIVIRIDSDATDELHVHSTPEHSFPVAASKGQSFQFTVDVPGRVDVELHEADATIATIQVQ